MIIVFSKNEASLQSLTLKMKQQDDRGSNGINGILQDLHKYKC